LAGTLPPFAAPRVPAFLALALGAGALLGRFCRPSALPGLLRCLLRRLLFAPRRRTADLALPPAARADPRREILERQPEALERLGDKAQRRGTGLALLGLDALQLGLEFMYLLTNDVWDGRASHEGVRWKGIDGAISGAG